MGRFVNLLSTYKNEIYQLLIGFKAVDHEIYSKNLNIAQAEIMISHRFQLIDKHSLQN